MVGLMSMKMLENEAVHNTLEKELSTDEINK